ncbi:MAG: hypothetical protein ACM3NQ_01310 [Bacteroidales bacterium]
MAGIGSGPISVNGAVVAYGQAFGWLTEDIALGQVIEGGRAYLAAIHTGMGNQIVPMTVPERAATFGACGSGRYQAVIQKAETECYGTLGELPGATVLDCAPDGTLAVRLPYRGVGGCLYAADGSAVALPDDPLLGLRVTGKGQATWIGGGRLIGPVRSVGLPAIRTAAPDVCSPLVVNVNGTYWITYECAAMRVVHPISDPENGYVVTSDLTYNVDAACVDGMLRLVWSVTAGEYPEHIRTWTPAGEPINIVARIPTPEPEPMPSATLDVSPRSGVAPLTVTTQIVTAHATTWRLLVDGQIVSADLTTDTRTLAASGVRQFAVRAAGPGGVVTSDPVTVTVTDAQPSVETRTVGLQTGFGGLIGRDLYQQLRRFGWDVARLDCLRNHLDPALVRESGEAGAIARLVDEAQAEGFRVVIIITSDQIPLVPDGIDVEVYADVTDTSTVGTEPDIAGFPPERIAAAINAQMSCSVAKKLRVWAGCISNPGPGPLNWLRRLAATLHPSVGLTVHRYPGELGDPASKGRKPYRSRAEEMAAIKAVVGTRKWAMSEGGCPVAKKGWWLWRRECTEAQQGSYIRDNRTLLLSAGADYVVHWQIRGESGILRDNSTWRPGAYVTATARPR